MEHIEHEVNFWEYCKKCRFLENKEDEEPCCDCLEQPAREDSHRPVCFKERSNNEG